MRLKNRFPRVICPACFLWFTNFAYTPGKILLILFTSPFHSISPSSRIYVHHTPPHLTDGGQKRRRCYHRFSTPQITPKYSVYERRHSLTSRNRKYLSSSVNILAVLSPRPDYSVLCFLPFGDTRPCITGSTSLEYLQWNDDYRSDHCKPTDSLNFDVSCKE